MRIFTDHDGCVWIQRDRGPHLLVDPEFGSVAEHYIRPSDDALVEYLDPDDPHLYERVDPPPCDGDCAGYDDGWGDGYDAAMAKVKEVAG